MLLLLRNGMEAMLSGGLAKGRWVVLGMVNEGDDWVVRTSHFTEVKGLVKMHSYLMQAVCTLLWIDCFETYMVVT